MEHIGDEYINLLAAVVRMAIDDAKGGDLRAVAWLDEVFPSWRRHADWLRPGTAQRVNHRVHQENAVQTAREGRPARKRRPFSVRRISATLEQNYHAALTTKGNK